MKTAATSDTVKTITTHYIDGSFVESHGREVMNVIKPTNGQVIARVTLGDEEDTRRAIAAAGRAFATFCRTTKEERAKILRRLHEATSARTDELTDAMIEEYGGVAQFSRLIVESGVNAFAAAERALDEIPWKRQWGKTTVTMEPVGVAGMITAWNANALFICLKLASAVAAGCTVVIKPSEMSSLQTRVLVEALHEAGLPKGVLNVVTGLGTTVGAELVRNPDVDKISFTGSVGVGESIMRDGAATMKRVTLELGGKSPTILLDDAALDEAVPAALVMAFMNSSQACAAGTRLLVPKSRLPGVSGAVPQPGHSRRRFGAGDGGCCSPGNRGDRRLCFRKPRHSCDGSPLMSSQLHGFVQIRFSESKFRSFYASPIEFNAKSAVRFISSCVAPFRACTARPAITVAMKRARSAGLMSRGISPALRAFTNLFRSASSPALRHSTIAC